MIGVEQTQDGFARLFSAAIFENLDVSPQWSGVTDPLSDFDRTVVKVVILYETSDESDDNIRRSSGGLQGAAGWHVDGVRRDGQNQTECAPDQY